MLHLYPLKSMKLYTCFKMCSFKGLVESGSESVQIKGLSLGNGGLLYQKCTFSV